MPILSWSTKEEDVLRESIKMTKKSNAATEEKIRKDGSLSEERKIALLKLVSTMKPEFKNIHKAEQNAKGMIKSSEHSTYRTIHQTKKHKHS